MSLQPFWKSDLSYKIGILPSCRRVSTVGWLHHLNFNKTPGEKTGWGLHKDAACCFKQILETSPYKTTVVQPLTAHHSNHLSKMSKIGWWNKNKLVSGIHLWTHQCWPTRKPYIDQFCTVTWCHLEDLARAMTNKDRWQKRVKESIL